ncbi:MAG: hypothetical protein HY820_42195 [Acidobacteria bacterium]|nr:hypothetical protein [Acidobacteriota bacterium]
MATLATWYDRFMGKGGAQANAGARWMEEKSGKPTSNRLRPFPNEDIHFFVKQIDNSRVIREADPQAPKMCWSMIGGASASAVLLIGMLLPTGYRLMAGYQIQDLVKQRELLDHKMAELELEEAKLLSPARLAELAELQNFVDPAPDKVIHLSEKTKQPAFAMRRPTQTETAHAQAQRSTTVAPPATTAAQEPPLPHRPFRWPLRRPSSNGTGPGRTSPAVPAQ